MLLLITLNSTNPIRAEDPKTTPRSDAAYVPPPSPPSPAPRDSLLDLGTLLAGDIRFPSDRVTGITAPFTSPLSDPTPTPQQTSEYMIGKVGVMIVFVESNGALDTNIEDWTTGRMQEVETSIQRALNWWAGQYPYASGKLSFATNSQRTIASTRYEPIMRPSTDDQLWVPDVLANINCGSGSDAVTIARSCAQETRGKWVTDWAFTIFVVDSFKDTDGSFSDGTSAFSYLFGPYMVVTYHNDGWGIDRMDRVVAHHIGHIFGATDESNGVSEKSGYLYTSDTENSSCIMHIYDWCVSKGTKGQIGWADSNTNNHPDILENDIQLEFTKTPTSITDQAPLIFEGQLALKPYQCLYPICRSITTNRLSSVTSSTIISARDGAFDSAYESFTLAIPVSKGGFYNTTIDAKDLALGKLSRFDANATYTYLIVNDSRRDSNTLRTNVGAQEKMSFRLFWAHNNSAVRSGKIWVEGVEGSPSTAGWFNVTLSSQVVGKRYYHVNEAEAPIKAKEGEIKIRSITKTADPLEVTWDRVFVQLSTERSRIDVSSSAPLSVRAYYESDGAVFQGSISLNDDSTQRKTGKYSYKATSIQDRLYGLTAFRSDEAEVVFDRVNIVLSSKDNRIDVGSEAKIKWSAKYESDGAPFEGEVRLNNDTTKTSVGRAVYKVSSIRDPRHGLTAFESNQIDVIFDRVIINLRATAERVNVATLAPLVWSSKYEYDNSTFTGQIQFNTPLTQDKVGRYDYSVSSISDQLHGISIFVSNRASAVFDKVKVTLTPEKSRIAVGKDAHLIVDARYLYDNSTFDGSATLNNTLTKNQVGQYGYTVSRIEGGRYKITSFESSTASIMFDRVDVVLTAQLPRVEVDQNASISYAAGYAYDGTAFQGKVHLNQPTVQSEAGRTEFSVRQVVDEKYGINIFASNIVAVIFDHIHLSDVAAEGLTPGAVKVSLRLSYTSDGSPVEDGGVTINGVKAAHVGGGVYAAQVGTLMPYLPIQIKVDKLGFNGQLSSQSFFPLGNTVPWIAAAGAIAGGVIWLRKRRKSSVFEEETVVEEEAEAT